MAFKSRPGYIGALTKAQKELEINIMANGASCAILAGIKGHNDTWRKFVNSHDEYVEHLDTEEEKRNACLSYDDQMTKKINFDSITREAIRRAKKEAKEKGECFSTISHESLSIRSKASGSSRLSTVSKKREMLAIAQLKLQQLERQQEMERKMSELQQQRELMEAQMEAEQAMVSLKIYEVCEGESEDDVGEKFTAEDEYFEHSLSSVLPTLRNIDSLPKSEHCIATHFTQPTKKENITPVNVIQAHEIMPDDNYAASTSCTSLLSTYTAYVPLLYSTKKLTSSTTAQLKELNNVTPPVMNTTVTVPTEIKEPDTGTIIAPPPGFRKSQGLVFTDVQPMSSCQPQ